MHMKTRSGFLLSRIAVIACSMVLTASSCPGPVPYNPDLAITSPFDIEIQRLQPDSTGEPLKTAFWEQGFTIHDQASPKRSIIRFKDAQLSIAVAADQETGGPVAYAVFRGSVSVKNARWSTSAEFNGMAGQRITAELLGEDNGLVGTVISDELVIDCRQPNEIVVEGEQKFRIENDTVNLFTLAKKVRLTPKPYEWRSCP